jgi:hypothetical protein
MRYNPAELLNTAYASYAATNNHVAHDSSPAAASVVAVAAAILAVALCLHRLG